MITENNTLTYANYLSVFSSWRPENESLFALCTAFLTTLLSYQVTAAIHDLFLGVKSRGRSKISNISLFLLANSSSPSYVFRNMVSLKRGCDTPRTRRVLVLIKLISLLSVAPLVNIAAVLLPRESVTEVSFLDSGFGGLALGINEDLSVLSEEDGQGGGRVVVFKTGPNDAAAGQFLLQRHGITHLNGVENPESWGLREGHIEIHVGYIVVGSSVLFVWLAHHDRLLMSQITCDFRQFNEEENHFPVFQNLTSSGAAALGERGGEMISEWCAEAGNGIELGEKHMDSHHALSRRRVACPRQGRIEDLRVILVSLARYVTLVQNPSLRMMPPEITGENGADRIMLLKRRRNYPSLLQLAVITLGFTALRVIVNLFTRNDIPRAIGLVLRSELGLAWCDSMLAGKRTVYFNRKHGFMGIQEYQSRESCSRD